MLHVSDLHLNPAGVVGDPHRGRPVGIDVVVDTGDITDWGSEPEASFVAEIGRLGVPYVYIRGNHDSTVTATSVAAQPGAVVLDNVVREVGGLRFAGIGDPRFTPDKGSEPTAGASRTATRTASTATRIH